tara:strand:- start:658 stop:1149 length:492 start_codon:yes stop_codon:yes gene_type:complete
MNLINSTDMSKNTQSNEWILITDDVMGGVSKGELKIISEDKKFFRLEGIVSTENNGGFIQFRSLFDINDNDFSGISFTTRGNNQTYFIHVRTKYTFLPWQYYSSEFNVSEDWDNKILNFQSFKKSNFYQPGTFDSSEITSIAFVAFGRDHDVKLDIMNAKLVK